MTPCEDAWVTYLVARYPATVERHGEHVFDGDPVEPRFAAGYEAGRAVALEETTQLWAFYESMVAVYGGIDILRKTADLCSHSEEIAPDYRALNARLLAALNALAPVGTAGTE